MDEFLEIGHLNLIGSGLFIKIAHKEVLWADIWQDKKKLNIRFYPHPADDYWEFDCFDVIGALHKAKNRINHVNDKEFEEIKTIADQLSFKSYLSNQMIDVCEGFSVREIGVKGFWSLISSDTVREFLFSEIYYEDEYLGEISQETGETFIQFWTPNDKKHKEFLFDNLLIALESAKNKLIDC